MNTAILPANKFAKYTKNYYSQSGEDGILEKILDSIPKKDSWCVGFDGTICLTQPIKLLWHGLEVADEDIQILSNSIRHFRSDYSFIQYLMYAMFILVKNPKDFFGRIKRKFNLDI